MSRRDRSRSSRFLSSVSRSAATLCSTLRASPYLSGKAATVLCSDLEVLEVDLEGLVLRSLRLLPSLGYGVALGSCTCRWWTVRARFGSLGVLCE